MNRVVLDTNVIVSASLMPDGIQAAVLSLAFHGEIALYLSAPVLSEYEEVLCRPRFKLPPQEIEAVLRDICKAGHFVRPTRTLAISPHESDNRFIECAEAADADYLVTGNARHFPPTHGRTKIVTGRALLEIVRV